MVVKVLETVEQYEAAIKESNEKLVVIDFFATWCGPCKLVAPQVEKFSDLPEFADAVSFYKLDVDELQEPAARNQVRAMPTFLVFKDEKKEAEVVGANAKALKAAISDKLAA